MSLEVGFQDMRWYAYEVRIYECSGLWDLAGADIYIDIPRGIWKDYRNLTVLHSRRLRLFWVLFLPTGFVEKDSRQSP